MPEQIMEQSFVCDGLQLGVRTDGSIRIGDIVLTRDQWDWVLDRTPPFSETLATAAEVACNRGYHTWIDDDPLLCRWCTATLPATGSGQEVE